MRLAIGFDHRGRELALRIRGLLASRGLDSETVGPAEGESSDYPDAAFAVARAVSSGRADAGVLVCNTGIGMSIAANKVPGVRAALATSPVMAEQSRRHNDSNILCLGAANQPAEQALRMVEAWLDAAFEGGRHARRIAAIRAVEGGGEP